MAYAAPPSRRAGTGSGWIWIVGLVAALVVALLVWAVFAPREPEPNALVATNTGATVSEIVSDPGSFQNQFVTVSGIVDDVHGLRAFTIGGLGYPNGAELLVVTAQPIGPVAGRTTARPIDHGDIAQITGPVRSFDLAQVEQDAGVDLDDGLFGAWDGRPVVIARRLEVEARGIPRPTSSGARTATLEQVQENVERFIGRRVSVSGQPGEMIGPRAFVLQDPDLLGDDELLIVSASDLPTTTGATGRSPFLEDTNVRVSGTVRRLDVAQIEAEIGADIDENQFADWIGKPAIVARSTMLAPTIDQLESNATTYLGRTITTTGEIAENLGPHAFVVEDADPLFDEEALVVTAQSPVPVPDLGRFPYVANDNVRVTGTVRSFNLVEIEREAGVDLDDGTFGGWDGRPVVVAQHVDLTPYHRIP